MKKSKAAVILVAILAAFAGLAYYASIILSSTGIGEEMSIPLGLDLSGGVSITYQVMDENPSAEDMSDTIYKLQKRVESYSTEASGGSAPITSAAWADVRYDKIIAIVCGCSS